MNYHLFSFFLLILYINYINSELQIIFKKYYSLNIDSFSLSIPNFVNYFIDNIFSTEILIGDPSQKITGFLNTDQSAFYLTNRTCPLKKFFYYEKSNTYKFIENTKFKYYTIFRFSESLLFDNITNINSNSKNNKCKIDNYEIFVDGELKYTLCFIIGTKLISLGEEIKDNLLFRLHENKYIKSYYFKFDINPTKDNELLYIFDLNIDDNKNDYTFIKTSSYNFNNKQYLSWGLNFEKIYFDNNILYENELRAEFSINLGCIMAPSSFKEELNKFLRKNNIMENLIQYSQKYDIYSFNDDDDIYDKLKNFTLDFYHKELNYHFILNYKDLFYTRYDKIYCLIIFSYQEKNFWKFGIPFLKKYKFIYNQDSKLIGFLNVHKNISIDNNNKNNDIENNINQKKFLKINGKIIFLVVVLFIFILIGMIFFGILIGKKLYKVRKNKTNELLELYDYNSKSDNI